MSKNLKTKIIRIAAGKTVTKFHNPVSPAHYILAAGTQLELFDVRFGRAAGRGSILVTLDGLDARVNLYGLFFGWRAEQPLNMEHTIRHLAPQTVSNIITRGVLGGAARAVYTGLIHIPKGIDGCDGRQEARTILLSPQAHLDAVPHLQIENNDVQCSHSLSVTYIDEIKKFYLESRGLRPDEALKIIIASHINPVLEKIPAAKQRCSIIRARQKMTKLVC